jgi:hypothetical protein
MSSAGIKRFEMWSLGHNVREVEQSHYHVVYEETATMGAVWMGVAFALLVLGLSRSATQASIALLGVGFALFASVRSTFTADRIRHQLIVKRWILFWSFERVYESDAIERIYVLSTRRGSGLRMRLKSGRNKSLTMSLDFASVSLEQACVAMNSYLHTAHHGALIPET